MRVDSRGRYNDHRQRMNGDLLIEKKVKRRRIRRRGKKRRKREKEQDNEEEAKSNKVVEMERVWGSYVIHAREGTKSSFLPLSCFFSIFRSILGNVLCVRDSVLFRCSGITLAAYYTHLSEEEITIGRNDLLLQETHLRATRDFFPFLFPLIDHSFFHFSRHASYRIIEQF